MERKQTEAVPEQTRLAAVHLLLLAVHALLEEPALSESIQDVCYDVIEQSLL